MSRANIEIEGDFAASGKESIPVEFLKGITSTAHLTQLGSMSLPDTSMAGGFACNSDCPFSGYEWGIYIKIVGEGLRANRIISNNILPIKRIWKR